MTRLISIFLFYSVTLFGQTNDDFYRLQIGKYKCEPNFVFNKDNSPGLLSPEDESKLMHGVRIFFPKRVDTTFFYDSETKVKSIKINIIDNYQFEAGIDSIYAESLDSLLSGIITTYHNDKKIKLTKYTIDLVLKDGKRKKIVSETKCISANKECMKYFNENKRIIYIGVYDIHFVNERRKKLKIDEGYGWKINYR